MKHGFVGVLLIIALFIPLIIAGSVETTTAEELPSSMVTSTKAEASEQAQPVDNPDIIVMEKVGENIEYRLPYPGILPDYPLYPLKLFRDHILDFFIRDPHRKIEFDLLMADKRLNMGVFLVEKGKYELALKTVKEGQEYFNKGIDLVNDLRAKDKNSVAKGTIDTYKKAASKHTQVLKLMESSAPENLLSGYNKLIQEAEDITQKLREIGD